MIPAHITETHIAEAIRRIVHDGVPPRRRGRDYCLATNGEQLRPKYTVSLAHQVATGESLDPDPRAARPRWSQLPTNPNSCRSGPAPTGVCQERRHQRRFAVHAEGPMRHLATDSLEEDGHVRTHATLSGVAPDQVPHM